MKRATAVCFLATLPCLAQETQTVELRVKPVPSTNIIEDTTSKLSFSFSILGQKLTTKAEQFRQVEVVTTPRLADGSIKVVRTTKQMRMKLRPPRGKSVEFDSKKPTGQTAAIFKPQLDAKLAYVFDKDNQLTSAGVDNPESIANLDAAAKAGFKANALVAARTTTNNWLPNKAVKPGDTWAREEEIRIDGDQSLKLKIGFTYQGIKDFNGRRLHSIDTKPLSVEIIAGPNAIVTGGELKPLKSSTGTIWFDAKTGRVEDRVQKIRLRGSVSANVGGRKIKTRMTVNFDSSTKLSQPAAKSR
jgi:hypothetical protein